MIGLGVLIRILRKAAGRPLEKAGVLPTRFYLREILEALDRDDVGRALRLLTLSRGAWVDRSRWELVRQQVIFRCRLLMEHHDRRIRLIEDRQRRLENKRRYPWRWFRKAPAGNRGGCEDLLALERRARALLEKYEAELKSM
ncbi:MAG: hypothetical protein JRH07_09510 [Deltaproteobacteria bacterium]|nr:hypothetical protein [Deltaproteobacteria bacterium]MBW2122069.1 hypothetical protein [Deltaproteobacteria bacterium]